MVQGLVARDIALAVVSFCMIDAMLLCLQYVPLMLAADTYPATPNFNEQCLAGLRQGTDCT